MSPRPNILIVIGPASFIGADNLRGFPLGFIPRPPRNVDTRMVEKHYGHLAPSFIIDTIHAGAPRFGNATSNLVPLRPGKPSRKI